MHVEFRSHVGYNQLHRMPCYVSNPPLARLPGEIWQPSRRVIFEDLHARGLYLIARIGFQGRSVGFRPAGPRREIFWQRNLARPRRPEVGRSWQERGHRLQHRYRSGSSPERVR